MKNAAKVGIVRFDAARPRQVQRARHDRRSEAPYTNSLKTGTTREHKARSTVDAKSAILK
jgi:hypothetical protein